MMFQVARDGLLPTVQRCVANAVDPLVRHEFQRDEVATRTAGYHAPIYDFHSLLTFRLPDDTTDSLVTVFRLLVGDPAVQWILMDNERSPFSSQSP